MNNKLEILNICVSDNDFRGWMQSPFLVKEQNKVFATNGHILVSLNSSYFQGIDFVENYADKISAVYPMQHNISFNISIADLKDKIAKYVPLIDEVKKVEKANKCKDCQGTGVVNFEFEDSKFNTYTIESECPVCEGEGKILDEIEEKTGSKIYLPKGYIQLGVCLFDINTVHKIIKISELMSVDSIQLVNQTEYNKANLFLISDVEFIAMPCMESPDYTLFFEIAVA